MGSSVTRSISWTFLITYVASVTLLSVQADDPKSEVEAVKGLILPRVPRQICMLRKHYLCKWSYEKSCSCLEMKRQKKSWHYYDVSFIRKRISKEDKKYQERSVETYD